MLVGKEILDELESIKQDCSYPNWDGYEGIPIQQETIDTTIMFLELIPIDLDVWCKFDYGKDELKKCQFSFTPESDGEIGIEWFMDYENQLIVSINKNKKINFACIIKGVSEHNSIDDFTESNALRSLFKLIKKLTS